MNKIIINKLQKPIPRLIFALICGLAYFAIIMSVISDYTAYTGLAGLFAAPLIICGGAYLVVRLLRNAFEDSETINEKSVYSTFYMNLIIIIIAVFISVAGR